MFISTVEQKREYSRRRLSFTSLQPVQRVLNRNADFFEIHWTQRPANTWIIIIPSKPLDLLRSNRRLLVFITVEQKREHSRSRLSFTSLQPFQRVLNKNGDFFESHWTQPANPWIIIIPSELLALSRSSLLLLVYITVEQKREHSRSRLSFASLQPFQRVWTDWTEIFFENRWTQPTRHLDLSWSNLNHSY